MEDQWLAWGKRLQALAETGQFFTRDGFDRERYEEISGIAQAMLARLGEAPPARIEALISESSKGYVTPKIDVRGAVIRDDTVLLVRERADHLWTLPGGFADVGFSPAENIEKEMREEAGLTVTVRSLYGVRHKARHPYDPDVRDFYKMFFLCAADEDAVPAAGGEVEDAAFFPLDGLPPLSTGRVIEADIRAAFDHHARPSLPTVFD